jgi:hypothetical protein
MSGIQPQFKNLSVPLQVDQQVAPSGTQKSPSGLQTGEILTRAAQTQLVNLLNQTDLGQRNLTVDTLLSPSGMKEVFARSHGPTAMNSAILLGSQALPREVRASQEFASLQTAVGLLVEDYQAMNKEGAPESKRLSVLNDLKFALSEMLDLGPKDMRDGALAKVLRFVELEISQLPGQRLEEGRFMADVGFESLVSSGATASEQKTYLEKALDHLLAADKAQLLTPEDQVTVNQLLNQIEGLQKELDKEDPSGDQLAREQHQEAIKELHSHPLAGLQYLTALESASTPLSELRHVPDHEKSERTGLQHAQKEFLEARLMDSLVELGGKTTPLPQPSIKDLGEDVLASEGFKKVANKTADVLKNPGSLKELTDAVNELGAFLTDALKNQPEPTQQSWSTGDSRPVKSELSNALKSKLSDRLDTDPEALKAYRKLLDEAYEKAATSIGFRSIGSKSDEPTDLSSIPNISQMGQRLSKALKEGNLSSNAANLVRITLMLDLAKGLQTARENLGDTPQDFTTLKYLVSGDGIARPLRIGSESQVKASTQQVVTDREKVADLNKEETRLKDALQELTEQDDPDIVAVTDLTQELVEVTREREQAEARLTGTSESWTLGIIAHELFLGQSFGSTLSQSDQPLDQQAAISKFLRTPSNTARTFGVDEQGKPTGGGAGALDQILNQLLNPDSAKRLGLDQIMNFSLFQEPGVGSDDVRELIQLLRQPDVDPSQIKAVSDRIGI